MNLHTRNICKVNLDYILHYKNVGLLIMSALMTLIDVVASFELQDCLYVHNKCPPPPPTHTLVNV